MTDTVAGTVRETAPLGSQWPTIDPFLFCAHHDDAYPAGDERMAPVASLEGRDRFGAASRFQTMTRRLK